ncbi:hypothetical protein B0O80DRAFT_456980 [Mortierella sp. GBAus27b]|nr:hypothetical protein B0O80DRAFT_456980 [Mortierella sp. GBAus27b]
MTRTWIAPTPSPRQPGSCHVAKIHPQRLDLGDLFGNHRTNSSNNCTRVVVAWAKDPGVKTLSENVFMTMEWITESRSRFQVLQGMLFDTKQGPGNPVSQVTPKHTKILKISLICRRHGHLNNETRRVERHRILRFGTILITDEYMNSQWSCHCFRKTRLGRSRRIVDSVGTQKLIGLHGAKECSNSTFPAFRIGYTTRPRGTQTCGVHRDIRVISSAFQRANLTVSIIPKTL